MKNLFYTFLVLVIASQLNAQTRSQRLVLTEEFSGAWWPSCGSNNPAYNTLLNANIGTKIVAVTYNDGDVLTYPDGKARHSYYGANFDPKSYKDGSVKGLGDGSQYPGYIIYWKQAVIDAEYALPSPFTMNLTWNFTPKNDSVNVTCVITATEAVSMTTPKLQIALIERKIHFTTAPGSNGEKDFWNICHIMVPNPTGTTLPTSWTNGQVQTFKFKQQIPANIYDKLQIAFVAFVQDNADKSVKQAAYAAPQVLNSIGETVKNKMSLSVSPNPFNSKATIAFSLNKSQNVSVKVYDLVGQEVATLINEESTQEGIHEVLFDASILQKGIYFCKIQTGDSSETVKMILVK